MVKQMKSVERAPRVQKKPEILQRLELLKAARTKHFQDDIKKHFAKTSKSISRKQPNINDLPVVNADSKIRIDLKADQPAEVQREIQIYKQTLDNVNKALGMINSLGVPTQRPLDYLAEMFKSDKHMEKIRTGLVQRQQTIKEKMQNKTWEKRKKRHNNREKRPATSEKKKKISKMMKRKNESKKTQKAPKMMKVQGKRKQKK